jgi:tRNA pseudouridine38-40 synthase
VPRYKLTIAYDGTDFCGWQKQEPFLPADDSRPADQRPARPAPGKLAPGPPLPVREGEDRPRIALRTVQHVVEQAVVSIVREPVVLIGASRTDAGVHAKGQVAAFTCSGGCDAVTPRHSDTGEDSDTGEEKSDTGTQGHRDTGTQREKAGHEPDADDESSSRRASGWPLSRGTDRLLRALNGRLPEDVLVVACEPVPPEFNPIGGCVAKGYSYTLHAATRGAGARGASRPLWDRRYVHQVWEPVDPALMQEAAARFVGEHDFAAFAAAGHGRLSTVRTIFDCRVTAQSAERLRIDVAGNGFLWNMVRIIAGTIVDAGRGRLDPADIPAILASKDRSRAGPTLPPTGLCLEWVRY